ncbi:MAG: V-type ATP synthase subunit F [Candidatus Aenigmarchaeota archaeon]|nr:V-type ATP synthase subunit F [Candidatus Aenigmarchaeota archaeon]
MMEIGVLGNEHFVAGFQLAGIRKLYVIDNNAKEKFNEAIVDPDLGILIMHSDEFNQLDEKSKDRALIQVQPTVIVLSHDVSTEESLRMMIIRAMGIDLWEKRQEERIQ